VLRIRTSGGAQSNAGDHGSPVRTVAGVVLPSVPIQ
jgi:hypothetical protein